MPSEKSIRQKVKRYYKLQGWRVWCPVKSRWGKEKDIFGIWDGMAWKGNKFVFFQFTTIANKAKRVKKVKEYMREHNLGFNSSCASGVIIAWDKKKGLRFFGVGSKKYEEIKVENK